ncbi:MAG: MgtC/SapB family protein [Gemmatimonadota bacterium]
MEWLPHLTQEIAVFFDENTESMLRMLLAACLGGIIGLERESSGKPAGFRTNLLICVGAALLTELSWKVASDASLPGGFRADPGRIAAQIVSGMGFLGAGTILHARGSVTGLTTAATLWVVAAIGMAAGAGAYVLAVVGTVLVMLALMILGRFEDYLLPRRIADRTIRVVVAPRGELVTLAGELVKAAGFTVASVDVEKAEEWFVASFVTRGRGGDFDDAVTRLLETQDVQQVTLL